MGTVWIKEFTGGLDTRRLAETTAGGVLIKARNVHLTRGGDVQKRAAFVPAYALPAGTIGMAAGVSSLYTFGSATPPVMPSGVLYQQLQHPDGVTALVRVLSVDLYAGKLYVVGQFADGSVFHFYDGTRVAAWFDGRARATFTVSGSGTAQMTDIKVDGVSIIGAPVIWSTNAVDFATAVANAINAYSSSPEYTATSSGVAVSIVSSVTGAAQNGKPITFTVANGLVVTPDTGLVLADGSSAVATAASGSFTVTGGTSGSSNKLSDLKVNGVSIISSAVLHTGNNTTTAAAIAAAINSFTSNPEYSATSTGAVVTIKAATESASVNGYVILPTVAGTFTVGSIVNMAGGVDPVFQPGSFVKTIGQKVYSTSGPNMHFSGIQQPTKFTTDTAGAGFIDMSSEASGSEELTALAKYQNSIAVFAGRVIQIWYTDPDPSLNRQSQVLNNTGTLSPKSVTQFGDNDLFYLDESGLRSLRARDASNAAATNDIGVSVDSLIVEKLNALAFDDRQNIIGLIEPRDGRFWLALKDTIFVFSYFPGSKISAWTTYEPTTVQGGQDVLFEIDDMVVFRRRVYARSGDQIYVYGGLSDVVQYDETEAEAWLPFLDGNAPAMEKNFTGVDAAVRGEWRVAAGMQPTAPAVEDHVATFTETTFNSGSTPAIGRTTHLSLRFRTRSASDAILSSAVIHYEGDQLEDK